MTHRRGRCILSQLAVLAALTGSCARDSAHLGTTESEAVVAFKHRVSEYVALHEKLEAQLPDRPDKATPQEVDSNQRSLADLIKEARRDAKPGEFFTPGMQAVVQRMMKDVLAGPDGPTIKSSIMDENPGLPQLLVNERYPSSVPLSTMPPAVLESLPKLKGELEYRFIGSRLILVDTEADMILDFTDKVFAK